MGNSSWENYWSNPGDIGASATPTNLKVKTVTTSSDVDIGGKLLYQTQTWIAYTPSVAIALVVGFGTTLVLASNTITGRYRHLSSEFILFEIQGNLVFGTGTGQALATLGLPPIHSVTPFCTSGSFIGITSVSTTPIAIPLVGYSAPSDTTVTIAPCPLQSGSLALGINSYAPASKTVTIKVSGVYEIL
jgi:hypothetical protein